MLGSIYKITNDLNNKVYIGQTIQPLRRRFYCHCCRDHGKGGNMYIKRAILKYGREHFKIELIETVEVEKLDEREIYWIEYYDSYNSGYNLTKGGNSNRDAMTIPLEKTIDIDHFKSFISTNPTLEEITKEFNICKASVYNLARRLNCELALTPKPAKKPKTVDDINCELLLQMYNDGWSIQDLVKYFHVRKTRISSYLKSLGIKPRRGIKGYKHRI